MKRYLIYANDHIIWNEKKGDWEHNDVFYGTWLDAHKYARAKYGKRYRLIEGETD
jgi:hypothetical protein